MQQAIVVSTTLSKAEEAEALARRIVESRLAACVQLAPVRSIYRWKGKVEAADETVLWIKTRLDRETELIDFLSAHHPYDVPEIMVTPITGIGAPYRQWLMDETKEDGQS